MLRAFRVLYIVSAWLFLFGLLYQVFLIGLDVVSHQAGALDAHMSLGWILHLSPLLVLLFAALARAGRRHWQWALALAVVVLIVPLLPGLATTSPLIGALHPVLAVVAVVLAAIVAWNSVDVWRMGSDPILAP